MQNSGERMRGKKAQGIFERALNIFEDNNVPDHTIVAGLLQ
jgi:hypothetical protein